MGYGWLDCICPFYYRNERSDTTIILGVIIGEKKSLELTARWKVRLGGIEQFSVASGA